MDNTMMEWKDLPWRKLERSVFKLQKRIFKASQRGDGRTVRQLQKTLMRSWSAKCLSVRRVTQDNQGKKTAGVDGVKDLAPVERLQLVAELTPTQKAQPTRRVWIPKPGSEEKRPLGIPTMKDRALQALTKQVLEPEWEARFEANSYGFRPGRSAHDAIAAIFGCISRQSKYVLDADIAKCFDRIDHQALLSKLNTYPTINRLLKGWLKSGVMDGGTLFPTSEGTPQGGVISPLLANIALHGMEQYIRNAYPKKEVWKNGKRIGYTKPAHFIRYADDFVILHEDLTVVQECQRLIGEWLTHMGLELKASKTRLTHTLYEHEGNVGFDFLGFTVRQYPVGKYQSGLNTMKQLLGFKTFITPAEKGMERHREKIKKIVKVHRASTQEKLIEELNPVIRGWSNYYSTVVSSRHFSKLDNWMYQTLHNWAVHRHAKKSPHWIMGKYWLIDQGGAGVSRPEAERHSGKSAATRKPRLNGTLKCRTTGVPTMAIGSIGRGRPCGTRMGTHPETNKRVSFLLKRQKGKCPHCKLFFKVGDMMEVDHTTPRSQGGKDEYQNLQLLHRHCHDTKTAQEMSDIVRCV